MPAIAATRRAQAAFSTRCHDSTAPAPEVSAVEATNDSNMLANLPTQGDGNEEGQRLTSGMWMNSQLCTTSADGDRNDGAAC
jgi:hypothetical protein